MSKKSFVMTGYVQRSTCNCGCITHNCFWKDGGFGGDSHLASLHQGIEKYCDELSGAGPGKQGIPHDVKITITIESLGEHDHRILRRGAFSGLGLDDNQELKEKITEPATAENATELKGSDEFAPVKLENSFMRDIHDRLLLVQRTGDMAKLEDLRQAVEGFLEHN
jgi:hypothetical protein